MTLKKNETLFTESFAAVLFSVKFTFITYLCDAIKKIFSEFFPEIYTIDENIFVMKTFLVSHIDEVYFSCFIDK